MLDSVKFFSLFSEFKPFEDSPTIAIAVSGGRDSLCLCILTSNLLERLGGKVIALTVNHNSMEEDGYGAEQTKKWLRSYSNVEVVEIVLPEGSNHSEKYWRKIRYDLTLDFCKKNNILHLMLGHQYDDQLETIAMRSKRNSSGIGLSGMAKEVFYNNVRIIRPLLNISRDEITKTLEAINQEWMNDPVNTNPHYERSRTRVENLDLIAMAKSNKDKYFKERIALEKELINRLVQGIEKIDELGRIEYRKFGDNLDVYALQKLILTVGGLDYPAGLDLCKNLLARGYGTLGKCLVKEDNGIIRIEREKRDFPQALYFKGEIMWDNRFKLVGEGEVIASKEGYPLASSGSFEVYFSPQNPIFSYYFS